MPGLYYRTVAADTPALWWPLDATYGANDQSSGGTNDGTAAGGITIGGFSDSPIEEETTCTDFDGSDDRVTSAYNPFSNGATRSFEGWAYRDASSNVDVLFGGTGTNHPLLRLVSGGTTVQFFMDSSSPGTGISWTNAWPGNARWVYWCHIFAEASDSTSLHLNGALVSTQTATGTYPASPGNFEVGIRGTSTDPFDGKFAHVAVYERALTASEIASHYQAGVTSISYWRMRQTQSVGYSA